MKILLKLCIFLFLCSELSFGQTAPVAFLDGYNTPIDTTLEIDAVDGLLQNDTDADGDVLNIVSFRINGVNYSAGQTATIPQGSITINADGSLTFNPANGFDGSVPVIVYTISDGTSTTVGNLFLTITSEEPAVAQDDFDTADIDTTLNVPAPGVLANDTFEDATTIAVVSFTINGTVFNAGDTANFGQGSLTLLADGSFVFIPAAGYTGNVPFITYTISDGTNSSSAVLFLTVEDVENLIELEGISSCNQGYSIDGDYRIQYRLSFRNNSTARDYHPSSMINTIDLLKDFDAIYGSGCATLIEDITVATSSVQDFINNPYPIDFDNTTVNQNFLDATSDNLFSVASINNSILYPRQRVFISFCLTVEPFCDGRPNPTPSGSGIDFEPVFDLISSAGESTTTITLPDFHTSEAIVIATLDIPVISPEVNPDGTYDYVNTVTLTNEGSAVANNFNFNMGLGSFFNNGLSFNTLTISQVAGPQVNVNTNYNGDTSTFLLQPNNSLAPGESVVLEIFYLLAPVGSSANNAFNQSIPSQTQGILDGFDEDTEENRRFYSFVTWEDALGNHLDRYYAASGATGLEANYQCDCVVLSMFFSFASSASSEKVITNTNVAPNGILEHQELTFQLSVTNTSGIVDLDNLQLQDNFSNICGNAPLSFTLPEIVESTATTNPNLNPNFNGVTNIDIFDGSSGLLRAGESITVEITIVLSEDCIGQNTINFSATDPLDAVATTTANVAVNASTDTDNDGVSNANDIDDDNDTILDVDESNGNDPLADDDSDFIPNYRDTDFGPDTNADGIVDAFDFDGDGVANHLDSDADNDGIFDIFEVGNTDTDTNSNGQTNNLVGFNGLDNTVETSDNFTASVIYLIPNNDVDANADYLDIDSDGDGIVDNIEAQPTDNYLPPSNNFTENGVDTAYPNGLTPIDTEGDLIADYLDTNSDGDIRDDATEGWDFDSDGTPETVSSGVDADNDGLDDAYDTDTTAVNPTNGQLPTDFPNADYAVTPERDWREIMAVVVVINNVSAVEGNDLQFTVSLVTFNDNSLPVQSITPIEITLFTSDGTETTSLYDVAVSPFDYTAQTDIQIVIPAFTETANLSVISLEDNISELDELFTLNANVTSNNTINTEATGIGTILDNDPDPSITMNDAIEFEGNDLEYTINLSNPSSRPTDIDIVSVDVSANSPLDYTSISTVLTINGTENPANPNLSTSFSITTLLDNLNVLDEEILNVFGNVFSDNVGNQDLTKTGTIIDIDPDPFMVISNPIVVEGNTLLFDISILNEQSELMRNYIPIVFNLRTVDVSTTSSLDYPFFSSVRAIPALESSISQEIITFDDELNEETETMNLTAQITAGEVSNPSNTIRGIGTIKDNDIPNLFSPNNDGRSDIFRIDGIEDFPNFKLVIFDRWGGEIYNYRNNGNPSPNWWDGTNNGNPVIEGVYFYTLDYNDGVTKPKTGFIQLVR
jgi:gliding motility-associated-like protein